MLLHVITSLTALSMNVTASPPEAAEEPSDSHVPARATTFSMDVEENIESQRAAPAPPPVLTASCGEGQVCLLSLPADVLSIAASNEDALITEEDAIRIEGLDSSPLDRAAIYQDMGSYV